MYGNKITNYFQSIPFLAKIAWLVFGLAKICGVFTVFLLFCPVEYYYLIKVFLPSWIILLVISVILALRSRKDEIDMSKDWWRYYHYHY